MNSAPSSFAEISQNHRLPIRIVSRDFGHLKREGTDGPRTHRLSYYLFIFMEQGCSDHIVDLENYTLQDNELLFYLPHQLRELPADAHGDEYFKLGFDEDCLSQLPQQYAFLLNPLNQQKISFSSDAAARVRSVFRILRTLLGVADTEPQLLLAHLHSLLTELDIAYFQSARKPADSRAGKFIGFKLFVENNLTDHPSVSAIAESLAVSTDSLYQIVKQYSGLSPRSFINRRLILEARRRLHYGTPASVKDLAFELGFNDPDYFSRLFKKMTGKTVAAFSRDMS